MSLAVIIAGNQPKRTSYKGTRRQQHYLFIASGDAINCSLSRKNRMFRTTPDDQPCHFRTKRYYSDISRNSERKKRPCSEAKQLYSTLALVA